jgi:hypothetical protein
MPAGPAGGEETPRGRAKAAGYLPSYSLSPSQSSNSGIERILDTTASISYSRRKNRTQSCLFIVPELVDTVHVLRRIEVRLVGEDARDVRVPDQAVSVDELEDLLHLDG